MDNQTLKLVNLYQLFLTNRDAGREAEAIAAMTELLNLVPDWEHGRGWMELAVSHFDCCEFETALECCEKARKFARLGQENLDYILDPLTSEILAASGKLEESLALIKDSLKQEVTDDREKGSLELNTPWSDRTRRLHKSWVKWNSSLYQRLYLEIPDGATYWRSLENSL